MTSFAAAVEERVRTTTSGVLEYFVLAARALRFAFSPPFYWRDLLGAENWRVELTFYDHELRVIAMESVQGLGFRIMGTPRS